jgi:hypothetical protein
MGMVFVSYSVSLQAVLTHFIRPIVTFIIILFLPSALTFLTLFIHRVRAARAARRERAPEDIVRSLPWLVWTGTGWEKHAGGEMTCSRLPDNVDLEQGKSAPDVSHDKPTSVGTPDASEITPHHTAPTLEQQTLAASTSKIPSGKATPWFKNQNECAICLSEFVVGDKVRLLPCQHIFHMDEVDEWLIQRKKLVSGSSSYNIISYISVAVPCLQEGRYGSN